MKIKMKMLNHLKAVIVMCALVLATACDSSNEPVGSGEAEFVITDAPIDDANVKSVFVTVADVKVDGKSIEGFSGKQTIDLKAYQEGKTKLLGNATLAARTYSKVTLVLDLDEDENGNAPGCYVETVNSVKTKLATTTSGLLDIAINNAWQIHNQAKSKIVIDFDLRKAIRYSEASDSYSFVAIENLNSAIRIVDSNLAGTIKGTYEDDFNSDDEQIIVYAYEKGTFNAEVESQPDENGLTFANAAGSTKVNAGVLTNSYTLAFMPAGEYELVFTSYVKDQTSSKFTFNTILNTETEVKGSLMDFVHIEAGVTMNVTARVKLQ